MSIRLIARDLYRLLKEVEQLERQVAATPFQERARLEDRLRKLKAEKVRMRRILDGHKESGQSD